MKYLLTLFLGLSVFLSCCCPKQSTDTSASNEGQDVLDESVKLVNNDTFIAAVIPPTLVRIAVNESSPNGIGFNCIKNNISEDEILVFAANGGMYDDNYKPIGLCVIAGNTVKPVAKIVGQGNFNLKFGDRAVNGIFMIDKSNTASVIPSDQYDNSQSSICYATQSGPLLLLNGEINPIFQQGSSNLNIRNGVGIDKDGNVVLVMSNKPINFYDFASLFRNRFHCQDALYLDGVVSQTYCPAEDYDMDGSSYGVIIYVTRKK